MMLESREYIRGSTSKIENIIIYEVVNLYDERRDFFMKEWIENVMGNVIEKEVEEWKSDFLFDKEALEKLPKGTMFLWEVRKTGTYLFPFIEDADSEFFKAVIETWKETKFFKGILGESLEGISAQEAENMISEWEERGDI